MFGLSFRQDDPKFVSPLVRFLHTDTPLSPAGELIHSRPSQIGTEVLEIRTGDGIHFQFGPSGARFLNGEIKVWGPRAEYLLERVIAPVVKSTLVDPSLIVHGSMVVDSTKAALLFGRSGTGKSSTAYALTHFGWKVATDDVAVIDVDSSIAYGAGTGALLRTPIGADLKLQGEPTREGKYRVADEDSLEQADLAVCAFLERGDSFDHRKMKEAEAYVALLRASFRFDPGTPEITEARSRAARELVSKIPCVLLTIPQNPDGPYPIEVDRIDRCLHHWVEETS